MLMENSSTKMWICNSFDTNWLMECVLLSHFVTVLIVCIVSYTFTVQYIHVSLPLYVYFIFFLVCLISTESWRKSPECLVAGLATVLVSGCFPKSVIIVVTFSLRFAESWSCLTGATLRGNERELSLWWWSSLGEQQQEEESHSHSSQELLHTSESIRDFLVGLVE